MLSASALSLAGIVGEAGAVSVLNGDFSQGNSAFGSGYTFAVPVTAPATYAVVADPNSVHPDGASFGDHTTGNGLMLVVNGATTPDVAVWEQSVAVAGTDDLFFSGWISSWGKYTDETVDPSPAILRIYINGVQVGSDFSARPENGLWSQFSVVWHADGAVQADIRIVDINAEFAGNDFSLDDLLVASTVPEPGSILILAV